MKAKAYKKELSEALNLAPEVVERLFNLFFTSIQLELEKLKNAIETGDMGQIYVISHKISGSASNLRLDEIMTLGKQMEEYAKEKSNQDYFSLYQQMVSAFDRAHYDVNKEVFGK